VNYYTFTLTKQPVFKPQGRFTLFTAEVGCYSRRFFRLRSRFFRLRSRGTIRTERLVEDDFLQSVSPRWIPRLQEGLCVEAVREIAREELKPE
jgi:hypothetical protein